MTNKIDKALWSTTVFLLTLVNVSSLSAQIRPLGTQYYENQYISNPAFAGMNKGLNVNLSYRNQWRTVPGSPVTMAFSGDYRFDKVGIGLTVYNDKAGLIGRTRVMGSYAYHLPLDAEDQFLHFGLSLGVLKESLDYDKIIAAPDDALAQRFNQRSAFIDGDFGIAYTNDRFTIQGALPNLSKFLQKDELNMIDGSTYFAAMSYKIGTTLDVVSIEPKISFRGAKDIEGIWDVGTNLRLEDNMLSFMGMYRSDKSSVLGIGINYDKYFIQCFYTSQLAGNRMRTGGDFEINLKINLFND